MEYVYFVSYSYRNEEKQRFGSGQIRRKIPITDMSDIRDIESKLSEVVDGVSILILNFQLLRYEGEL